MSDERVHISKAAPVIKKVAGLLKGTCTQLQVAGSVRRGVQNVKDVELVAVPDGSNRLLSRLDRLVYEGEIEKSLYGDARVTRWGEKYRGFDYEGIRFEIFITDEHSWGYQFWLRTGPGITNTYVMQQMLYQKAPYRFDDGALWHAGKRVSVPNEIELFRLLGMPYIEPEHRSEAAYQQYLRRASWATPESLTFVEVPQGADKPSQSKLF